MAGEAANAMPAANDAPLIQADRSMRLSPPLSSKRGACSSIDAGMAVSSGALYQYAPHGRFAAFLSDGQIVEVNRVAADIFRLGTASGEKEHQSEKWGVLRHNKSVLRVRR